MQRPSEQRGAVWQVWEGAYPPFFCCLFREKKRRRMRLRLWSFWWPSVWSEHMSSTGDHSPYELLGVPLTASMVDITRAYRQLATQVHPDKVAHLAPEFRALAEQRMKDLNAAYDAIKKMQHDPAWTPDIHRTSPSP